MSTTAEGKAPAARTAGPAEAWRRAKAGPHVLGWLLDEAERAALLLRFPPTHARVLAHHVTLKFGVAAAAALPPDIQARIVGRADDHVDRGEDGIEAMVVEIDGTVTRPDGGTYHVTWSLGDTRKPRESNDVIRTKGWVRFDEPVPVRLQAAVFG